jgi:tRNA 2-thiouridine synthesizing protein A
MSEKAEWDYEIDASGYNCPVPIIKAKKLIDTILIGQTVKLISTDPGSIMDISTFCKQTKNKMNHQELVDGAYIFIIEKC